MRAVPPRRARLQRGRLAPRVGGECASARSSARRSSRRRGIWRVSALELVGEIDRQVVTLTRCASMASIQRHLEVELGMSRSLLSDREEICARSPTASAAHRRARHVQSGERNHFLGLMSHELRTPLSVILGFGSILHDGLAGRDPGAGRPPGGRHAERPPPEPAHRRHALLRRRRDDAHHAAMGARRSAGAGHRGGAGAPGRPSPMPRRCR